MCLKLGGGAGAARALRLLLLFVLALAAVEYIFGSILDASPLRTYLYIPGYNTTPAALRNEKYTTWPKRIVAVPAPAESSQVPPGVNSTQNATIVLESQFTNSSVNVSSTVSDKAAINMTKIISNNTSNYNETVTPNLITRIIEIARSAVTTQSSDIQNVTERKKLCPEMPPDLGPVKVDKKALVLEKVDNKYPEVSWGGRFSPPDCLPRHKVAIIVPYRDRERHLPIFLNHMHPFLMKQQLEYGIFIIEQSGESDFNRAKLMNVGFEESQKLKDGGWQCFIFHDIDLLPLDGRNLYSCPRQPRHMSASIDKLNFKLPYQDIFGGVSAMTREQFIKVNGFSNKYWGWGGEDDDMFYRLQKRNYHIARYKMSIARYAMLYHKKSMPNPKRYQLLSQTSKSFLKDGLSTLEYELVDISQHHLYTHIVVNIDERS